MFYLKGCVDAYNSFARMIYIMSMHCWTFSVTFQPASAPEKGLPNAKIQPSSCWVPWNRLQPLDIQMAFSKKEETDDEDLAKAYTEAIEQWDNHNIQYWIDKLLALRYMSEDEGKIVKATKVTKRKRTDSPTFRNPLGLSKFLNIDNVDDDEGMFAPVKKEPKEEDVINLSFEQDRSLYDHSDSEELQQRAKVKRNGKFSVDVAPSLFTPPTTPAKTNVGGPPQESVSPQKT